jgi:hypothetical protein
LIKSAPINLKRREQEVSIDVSARFGMVGQDEELASHAYIYAVAKLHPPLASWGRPS